MLHPGYSYSGSVVNRDNGKEGVLPLAALFFLLCECQVVFGQYFTVSSFMPDLLLVAVIATGVFRGTSQGFWFGLYGGLLQEISSASGADFGYLVLMKMLAGWVCGKLADSVRSSFIAVPVVIIALATFIQFECLSFLSKGIVVPGWDGILFVLANSVVGGLPVYYLIYFLPGRSSS